MDTIEILNTVSRTNDLWEEMNKDSAIFSAIINFPPNSSTTFRILGPFQLVKRMYMNYEGDLLSKRECFNIATGDLKVYDMVRQRIEKELAHSLPKAQSKEEKWTTEAMSKYDLLPYIERVYQSPPWQRCLMVNAWFKSGANSYGDFQQGSNDLKVCCLTQSICSNIITTGFSLEQVRSLKVGGLDAHDITIQRTGSGLQSSYTLTFSPEATDLGRKEVSIITKKGLWDIEDVIQKINESGGRYIFRASKKYRMPEEINDMLFSSYKENEGAHYDAVREQINDLPHDAIEGDHSYNNTIQNLEI